MKELMNLFCRERPVGTADNAMVNAYLEERLGALGFGVRSIPFDCVVWEKGVSRLDAAGGSFEIMPSPFSEGFVGDGTLVFADTTQRLEQLDCGGAILLLGGELTQEALQPKDYPFYYPDEHKQLIETLERKAPRAIVALTGSNPLCGLSPFPLFEDGNFLIPSAYMSDEMSEALKKYVGSNVHISIISSKRPQESRQLVATKYGKNRSKKLVVCAHMDTKYDTPGALDNAAGVAVLMEAARNLIPTECSIDVVPFNGEEYYGACGELAYLRLLEENEDTIALLVNIDSPCHIGADTAVSFYNFDAQSKEMATRLFEKHARVVEGEPWYAGDHSPFIFSGTPCAAVASSDLFDGGLANTHTPTDTMDRVDTGLIADAAGYITALTHSFDKD